MADLLTRVQRELEERIATLRPLVEEARQLEEALEALNGARAERAAASATQSATTASPLSASRRRPAAAAASPASTVEPPAAARPAAERPPAEESPQSARSRISREQADERRRQALAIITENPGTTASNLALLLDTSTGTMHSLLKRLEAEGEIEKAEKGYARPQPKKG